MKYIIIGLAIITLSACASTQYDRSPCHVASGANLKVNADCTFEPLSDAVVV